MGCSKCGTGLCKCGCSTSGVASPYYTNASMCVEDHTQNVIVPQFEYGVCPRDAWNVPQCGGSAVLSVPGLAGVSIGSFIWAAGYGYFEIVAADSQNETLTITNLCTAGNANPGSQIPACTCFTVTVPPIDSEDPTTDTCLAADFTAPALSDCVLITVTTIGSIQPGDEIKIGTGRYVVSEVNSLTTITICNEGFGITPGTPVYARDINGNYQYCFIILANCCTRIEEAFGGALTPCSNFENVVLSGIGVGDIPDATQLDTVGETAVSTLATVVFENTSTCRTMHVMAQYEYYFNALTAMGSTDSIVVGFLFELRVNGGAWATIFETQRSMEGDGFSLVPEAFSNADIHTILPGVTLTVDIRLTIELVASNDPPNNTYSIADFIAKLTMLGVAA